MMRATDMLHALAPFQQLLQEVQAHEQAYLQNGGSNQHLQKNIRLAYSFIMLTLLKEEVLYAKITFELKQDQVVLNEVYTENTSRKVLLEKLIQKNIFLRNFSWSAAATNEYKSGTVITRCLAIADAIADRAVNCARGDEYRPGRYSSVLVTDEKIVLSQINRMNAKSLDHKNDYSLRDLEFTIPLIEVATPQSGVRTTVGVPTVDFLAVGVPTNRHNIGPMLISFSDHSSANNRACGERILEQIEREKAADKD